MFNKKDVRLIWVNHLKYMYMKRFYGLERELELIMINKISVFELLMFNCMENIKSNHIKMVFLKKIFLSAILRDARNIQLFHACL